MARQGEGHARPRESASLLLRLLDPASAGLLHALLESHGHLCLFTVLDARKGLCMLDENAKMRFVAAPHLLISAYSRRIVQRTGAMDANLSKKAQAIDYALRMLHAGGKMFSLPYLVASTSESIDDSLFNDKESLNDFAYALFKSLGLWKNRRFLLRHFGTLKALWKRRKELEEKRNKAILLSKLDKNFLDDLG